MKLFVLLILALTIPVSPAFGLDEIRLQPGVSALDHRNQYSEALLKRAMDATVHSDGPYAVTYSAHRMQRKRGLEEVVSGKRINVFVAPAEREWEAKTLAVRIPVYKGIQGYRLLLVTRQNLEKFAAVRTADDLKKLRGGYGAQWTITSAIRTQGFTVVSGTDYEGMFYMLAMNRFDYFSRGLNEIYAELQNHREEFPEMLVEPTLALYCPLPNYFYVSPRYPGLADRIRRGLEILLAEGTMDAMLHEWFGRDMDRAHLPERRILKVRNPLLPEDIPVDRPELWYAPM